MLQETRDIIVKNFVILMQECDVDILKVPLIEQQVFAQQEMDKIFSTSDARHNKRIFFFELQKKPQRAFGIFVAVLRQTNQSFIAGLLQPNKSAGHHKIFHQMKDYEAAEDEIPEMPQTPVTHEKAQYPLKVMVIPSKKFYDTQDHNRNIDFYHTRSKKRGRVLIINNVEFLYADPGSQYRNGAGVDNDNLIHLFRQMGGWDVDLNENKTAEEMKMIIKDFAQHKNNKEYDICFVIVMSHGNEICNDTVIYGIDNGCITASGIQKEFSNDDCTSFRGKPKVFLFQVCRGNTLHQDMSHFTSQTTYTDSLEHGGNILQPPPQKQTVAIIRYQEDILVGFATLLGSKAHRNPILGSWYIELLCKNFMSYSHNTAVDDLLTLVDQDLRRRISEKNTVQTSEHSNRGFKKLYLHPGIYCEDDVIKTFFN